MFCTLFFPPKKCLLGEKALLSWKTAFPSVEYTFRLVNPPDRPRIDRILFSKQLKPSLVLQDQCVSQVFTALLYLLWGDLDKVVHLGIWGLPVAVSGFPHLDPGLCPKEKRLHPLPRWLRGTWLLVFLKSSGLLHNSDSILAQINCLILRSEHTAVSARWHRRFRIPCVLCSWTPACNSKADRVFHQACAIPGVKLTITVTFAVRAPAVQAGMQAQAGSQLPWDCGAAGLQQKSTCNTQTMLVGEGTALYPWPPTA